MLGAGFEFDVVEVLGVELPLFHYPSVDLSRDNTTLVGFQVQISLLLA